MTTNAEKVSTKKSVYTIIKKPNGSTVLVRIGVCVVESDGTWSVTLDAIPVDGIMKIRDE